MASLTPQELQEARRASGRLGGRPRKPTRAEARAAQLERLMPKALVAIEEALDTGDIPTRLRAAVKLLEYDWGKPPEQVTLTMGDVDAPVESLDELTDEQLEHRVAVLRARVEQQQVECTLEHDTAA